MRLVIRPFERTVRPPAFPHFCLFLRGRLLITFDVDRKTLQRSVLCSRGDLLLPHRMSIQLYGPNGEKAGGNLEAFVAFGEYLAYT